MNRTIIHQQIEFLLKKINEQHERVRKSESSIPQPEMDVILQNLRQLYEAVLMLHQDNALTTLDEMHSVVEQKILAEKRALELKQSQQKQEEVAPVEVHPVVVEIAEAAASEEEVKTEKQKAKKISGNLNTSLFENVPTLGGKFSNEETLHSKIAGKTAEHTLSKHLHHKPVSDLKAAIGINEKFLFINKLFEGKLQEYTEAIERINKCVNLGAAKSIIEGELAEKYNWENDSEPVREFLDLVERRFIS
jgi:hypothetical protein